MRYRSTAAWLALAATACGLLSLEASAQTAIPATKISWSQGHFWHDDFIEQRTGTSGTHWTQVNQVAGTTTTAQDGVLIATGVLQIRHNVAAQGPSVYLGGTVMKNGIVVSEHIDIGYTDYDWNFEVRVSPAQLGHNAFYYLGLRGGTVHPLLTSGALNVTNTLDGAGFYWDSADAIPVPVLWDNGIQRTLTGLPTLEAWGPVADFDGIHVYRVRVVYNSTTGLETVYWYEDGVQVYQATPGGGTPGTFASRLTAGWGLIANAASMVSIDTDYATIWGKIRP